MRQNLSKLMEGELDKAELVLAAKGISEEVQSMAEKVAKLQVDELMPLIDRLKEIFGNEMATAFNDSVDGVLSSLLDNLKSSKDEIENQANILNGDSPEYGSDMNMNADPGMGGLDMGMDGDTGMDDGMGDMDGGMDGMDDVSDGEGDIFGASDPGAGGSEPLGRAKRESRKIKGKKISEMTKRMRVIEKTLKSIKAAK